MGTGFISSGGTLTPIPQTTLIEMEEHTGGRLDQWEVQAQPGLCLSPKHKWHEL